MSAQTTWLVRSEGVRCTKCGTPACNRLAIYEGPEGALIGEGSHVDFTPAIERLLAAAPQMLAKLEQLAGECAECRGTGFAVLPFSGGQSSRARCPDCADIRAVIARATQP